MLYKEELKKVPLCAIPKVNKKELKNKNCIASAKIENLHKSGKTLVIDYYGINKKELLLRFFCDKENYILYAPVENKWSKGFVTNYLLTILKTNDAAYIEKELELCKKFLKIEHCSCYVDGKRNYGTYSYGIVGVVDRFIKDQKQEQKIRAADNAEALFCERQSWFPEITQDIKDFCNAKAFKEAYLFYSKLDKNKKRKCTCSKCGKRFAISHTPKHKSFGECPKCNAQALWFGEQYQYSIQDETRLCTAYRHERQLILRWHNVTRRFCNLKPQLRFNNDAYTFYINKKGFVKPVTYLYMQLGYYWGVNWTKARNNQTCYHPAYVYTGNLYEVFGEKYCNVDLVKVLENQQHKINFVKLLDNLKKIPQTEYMCKLGLVTLAAKLDESDYGEGNTFSDILGITKQYLPMYKSLDISEDEHRLIKDIPEFVSEELFSEFRILEIETGKHDSVKECLKYQKLQTLINYISKQNKVVSNGAGANGSRIVQWLSDYYGMCDDMDIPINKGTVRPRELKKTHDTLVERYNIVKADIKDRKSKAALELVNNWFTEYSNGEYCIKVPHYKSDFVREGQALNHCVGRFSYYDNHIKGERMIFFVRKTSDPDAPFYTTEIDMMRCQIIQLYGYGDKVAPKKIWTFTKNFVEWMQKQLIRKAG